MERLTRIDAVELQLRINVLLLHLEIGGNIDSGARHDG